MWHDLSGFKRASPAFLAGHEPTSQGNLHNTRVTVIIESSTMVQLQILGTKYGRGFTVDVGEDATVVDVKFAVFEKNKKVDLYS